MNLDLLLEAERRGILPETQRALLDEARRRGLVPSLDATAEGLPPAQEAAPATRNFRDRLIDNVVGRDDGVFSPGERLATMLNMGGESLTLGVVGDEAAAAADALVGRGGYDERLTAYRGNEEQLWDENPMLAAWSVIAPAFIPGAGLASAATRASTLGARMGRGALAGAGAGGLYGFMEGEGGFEDRKGAAATGATVGVAMGGALPGIARVAEILGGAVRSGRANRALVRAQPSLDDLAEQSGRAYAAAESASPIPRAAFAQASDDILSRARDAGYHPKIQTKSRVVLDEIANAADTRLGSNVGFRELETLRRQAKGPAGMMGDAGEQAVGASIISGIDEFVDKMPDMGGAAREARKLWSSLRQTEMLDEAFARAGRSASGFENGLRIEFRRILNNKSMRRGLSEDTIEAMNKVINGTPASNFLRRVARMMGPGAGAQTNMLGFGLSGAGGAAAASAMGIPPWIGPIVTGLTGYGAQRGAESMTRAQAEVARALAASGGVAPRVSRPQLERIAAALGISQGATTGGMLAPQ